MITGGKMMADNISSAEIHRAMVKTEAESFIFGLPVGAIIGGGIALLYAPAKGSETRKMLKAKALEAEKTIEGKMADLREKIEELSETVTESIEEVKNKTKQG
jgi:gas vesicle protein